MLSKAPPVPQLCPSETPEEQPTKIEEGDAQAGSQNSDVAQAAEGLPNPSVGERVVEEHQESPANANPGLARERVPSEVHSSNQVLQRQEVRAQRPADDRLFTWAAVGLTIAIVVLLLKKFMNASGHGAVFMDGS